MVDIRKQLMEPDGMYNKVFLQYVVLVLDRDDSMTRIEL